MSVADRRGMIRRLAPVVVAAALVFACGGSASNVPPLDGGGEGSSSGGDGGGPVHTATHDCAPACGAGKFCEYPLGPGICPSPGQADAGFCPEGCLGCPALPPPACTALPAACAAAPSCDCLLSTLCTGCGIPSGTCTIDADGDWVIGCVSC